MPTRFSAKPKSTWPSIQPGRLRHKIQVQQQTTTRDSFGEQTSTWTTVLTTMADIQAVGKREIFVNDALISQITHSITVRYTSAITFAAGMRIVFGPHTYRIEVPVNVEERNIKLELLCLEVNPLQ